MESREEWCWRVQQAALYHRWRQQEGPTMEVTRRLAIFIIIFNPVQKATFWYTRQGVRQKIIFYMGIARLVGGGRPLPSVQVVLYQCLCLKGEYFDQHAIVSVLFFGNLHPQNHQNHYHYYQLELNSVIPVKCSFEINMIYCCAVLC